MPFKKEMLNPLLF